MKNLEKTLKKIFEQTNLIQAKIHKIKIYVTDTQDPFLFTGYIAEVQDIKKKIVNLQPCIGLNIRHSDPNGLFGYPIATSSYSDKLSRNSKPETILITTSFRRHKQQASKLVKQVCGEETQGFKKYILLADYL